MSHFDKTCRFINGGSQELSILRFERSIELPKHGKIKDVS